MPYKPKILKGGDNKMLTENIDIYDNIILFILYFFILLIVGVSFDRIAKNTTGVSNQTYTFAFIGIFICISGLIIIFGVKTLGNINIEIPLINIKLPLIRFVFLFILIGFVFVFSTNSYLVIGISILIAIVGLSNIFNLFYNRFERSIRNTYFKFIIELIFFLPCLFNDILKWGLEQINMTPYFTYVLLIIEIILILMYIYLPTILNRIVVGKDGKVLQKAPFYINKGNQLVIATSADLSKVPIKPDTKPDGSDLLDTSIVKSYNTDYALSMWININPHHISNKEIVILSYFHNYVDNNKNSVEYYKPKIVYTSNSDTSDSPSVKDVYRIYFTGNNKDKNNSIEIHVPNQRWNHFLFNYVDGKKAELWINGVLERVMTFSENIPVPQYDATDQIVIGGTNATGTNGAICNVIYFDKSISSHQIVNMYNFRKPTFF